MVEIPSLVLHESLYGECVYLREVGRKEEANTTRFSLRACQVADHWLQLLQTAFQHWKRALETVTIKENLGGHFLSKLVGRKKTCALCATLQRKRPDSHTFKALYAC